MSISVVCEFEDCTQAPMGDDFVDLKPAIAFALALADRLGRKKGDGHGRPNLVLVLENSIVQMSIKVFRGDRHADPAH